MATTPIVRLISESFIKPKYELEDAINPVYLAPEDLVILSSHYIQEGLLFSKPSPTNNHQEYPIKGLLDNLKHSLSLALVHFYPLAGRLETQVDEDQHSSLVFIDCNKGPGAGFIHAILDMTVSEILSPEHIPPVVHSLFDHHKAVNHDGHTRPLLSVQVTELIDGVFIGCSMNHTSADGISYWNFFNTWSEIFMANNGENLLISRPPPIHKRWFVDGAGPIIKLPYTSPDEFVARYEPPELLERVFHFSAESIVNLKAKANKESGRNNNISSLQALAGLIWRSITKARCFPDDEETVCSLSIDNRVRLDPPLSSNCFGNMILTVRASSKAGELLSQNLGWAASLVHQAVVEHTSERVVELIKGLTESPRVVPVESFRTPGTVHIGSSPRFDVYGNEFGMGKGLAVLSGSGNKYDGKVSSFPGRDGGGSIDLEVCLLPDYMRAIEADEELMEAISG